MYRYFAEYSAVSICYLSLKINIFVHISPIELDTVCFFIQNSNNWHKIKLLRWYFYPSVQWWPVAICVPFYEYVLWPKRFLTNSIHSDICILFCYCEFVTPSSSNGGIKYGTQINDTWLTFKLPVGNSTSRIKHPCKWKSGFTLHDPSSWNFHSYCQG